jgi:hypothetical protein
MLCTDRVPREDGLRQERTAEEILKRLARQPGVVLADEVGMGKTFVAMAVAASILLDRFGEGTVVVMVPPGLRDKWPKDWAVFCDKCLRGQAAQRFRERAAQADSGVEFLRKLNEKPPVLFLTHGALQRALTDGFAKLAVLKRAFKYQQSLKEQRRNFPKFAGRLLRMRREERLGGRTLFADLIREPYENWKSIIHRANPAFTDDVMEDPVPGPLADALKKTDPTTLEALIEELGQLPLRESANIEERLKSTRQALAATMADVWKRALREAQFTSPLLILDEAHHLKNPATHLASLFVDEEAAEESHFFEVGGALGGKFERMLFLTATPFQLGHPELIHVLERFEGIAWNSDPQPELMSRATFKDEIKGLRQALDEGQAAALRLDQAWGGLTEDHLRDSEGQALTCDQWWETVQGAPGDGAVGEIIARVDLVCQAMGRAETALRPWVLRHRKPEHLSVTPPLARRRTFAGAAIRAGGNGEQGLEIEGDVLLPFLLAGRAQALLATSESGRALFAEGLASSFEAYFETRDSTSGRGEEPDQGEDRPVTVALAHDDELSWYLHQLDAVVPRDSAAVRRAHPKVRATAERVVQLWRDGEKVLVFCHYRATGRALRRHISDLLHHEVSKLGQERFPQLLPTEIPAELERWGKRFFDSDGALWQEADHLLRQVTEKFLGLADDERVKFGEVVRRFLRTPAFLVRYFNLSAPDSVSALRDAFEQTDTGGLSLRQRLEDFCKFLAERCISDERRDYLDSLESIQTGSHVGATDAFDPGEVDDSQRALLLPNVRLVNGQVKKETRRRLLLTFNTPLFPEILIASRVLAEGVDLHLNCRHVIHHDLDWNPSLLEQRTGRVDRLGCKAERDCAPIQVYLPYVAATQDEKMFRVVRDRERWFQIIMGEKYETAEAATDRHARRIPLPKAVQLRLALHLHADTTLDS